MVWILITIIVAMTRRMSHHSRRDFIMYYPSTHDNMIVMTKMDIALNITLHNEGDLLYKTFQSIALNVKALKEEYPKLKVQANVSLDCPDDYTKQFFAKSKHFLVEVVDELRHYTVDFGDLSLSRNYLINKALSSKVKYIQIYDGDDLFSIKYLLRMYQLAIKAGKPVVIEPEFILDMDEWSGLCRTGSIRKLLASNDPHQLAINMYANNLYQSQIFVSSSIFEKIKYTPGDGRYRYEDYHILIEMIASGYDISVAPSTMILYRRKLTGSLLTSSNSNCRLCLAPSRFFSPRVFSSLNHRNFEEMQELSAQLDAPVITNRQSEDNADQYIKIHRSSARNVLLYGKRLLIETVRSAKHIGRSRKNQKRLNTRELKELNLKRLSEAGFSQEMFDDIRQLNNIEPLATYDTAGFINLLPIYTAIQSSGLNDIYYRLCSLPDIDRTTDLLLIPHLTKGGADKAMVELCQALSEHNRSVLVIGTNAGDDNSWRDKLNKLPGVTFLERDDYFPVSQINDKDLEIMLLRVIQNWPKLEYLTVMNSGVGYNLINEWHDEIKRHVKIIVHDWCYGVNDCGLIFETTILSKVYRYIDCLVTDGDGYKKQLMKIHGWDGRKITPIALPINPVNLKQDYVIKHHIMYAGRFSAQKRLDLVLTSHRELAKHGIQLDIYGSVDKADRLYDGRDIRWVEQIDNARYQGPFNGFNELPIDQVDLLILPTQYEGLPNIVLEALKANLFVIAGKCGSLPEVIEDGKNGFLVDDNGNAKAYLEAILKFYDRSDQLLSPDERKKFNQKILHEHDRAIYQKHIGEVYGW